MRKESLGGHETPRVSFTLLQKNSPISEDASLSTYGNYNNISRRLQYRRNKSTVQKLTLTFRFDLGRGDLPRGRGRGGRGDGHPRRLRLLLLGHEDRLPGHGGRGGDDAHVHGRAAGGLGLLLGLAVVRLDGRDQLRSEAALALACNERGRQRGQYFQGSLNQP